MNGYLSSAIKEAKAFNRELYLRFKLAFARDWQDAVKRSDVAAMNAAKKSLDELEIVREIMDGTKQANPQPTL